MQSRRDTDRPDGAPARERRPVLPVGASHRHRPAQRGETAYFPVPRWRTSRHLPHWCRAARVAGLLAPVCRTSGSAGRRPLFEVYGRQVAEGGVSPVKVVPSLDELEDRLAGRLRVREAGSVAARTRGWRTSRCRSRPNPWRAAPPRPGSGVRTPRRCIGTPGRSGGSPLGAAAARSPSPAHPPPGWARAPPSPRQHHRPSASASGYR